MASVTLVSTRQQLGIETPILTKLIYGVASLTTFWGVITIIQIIFCLERWKGYRRAERSIAYLGTPYILYLGNYIWGHHTY